MKFVIKVLILVYGLGIAYGSELKSKLTELKHAYDAQLISKVDYEAAKQKLLSRFLGDSVVDEPSKSDEPLGPKEQNLARGSSPANEAEQKLQIEFKKSLNELVGNRYLGLLRLHFVAELSNEVLTDLGTEKKRMPGHLDVILTSARGSKIETTVARLKIEHIGNRYTTKRVMDLRAAVKGEYSERLVSGNLNYYRFVYDTYLRVRPGKYKVEIKKRFNFGSNGGGRKSRKYAEVVVKRGKVTYIPYFWKDNSNFGIDHQFPPYLATVVSLSKKLYQDSLHKIYF